MIKPALIAMASIVTSASAASPAQVQITIQSVTPGKGPVIVSVYQSSATWLKKDKALEIKTLEATGKSVIATLNLEPGTYAFQAFQDENNNNRLDMNWLPPGPGEPWVVSNNAQGTMGPPSFKDAAVTVTTDQKLAMLLQQP